MVNIRLSILMHDNCLGHNHVNTAAIAAVATLLVIFVVPIILLGICIHVIVWIVIRIKNNDNGKCFGKIIILDIMIIEHAPKF